MERNGIPLYFTMFGIRLLYPVIVKINFTPFTSYLF